MTALTVSPTSALPGTASITTPTSPDLSTSLAPLAAALQSVTVALTRLVEVLATRLPAPAAHASTGATAVGGGPAATLPPGACQACGGAAALRGPRVVGSPASPDASPQPPATPVHAAAPVAPATAAPDDARLADDIARWMRGRTPDTPLAAYTDEMVAAGRRHGVDPRLVAAIAAAESTLATQRIQPHNAWGIMQGGKTFRSFGSWEEGIDYVASLLRRGYLDEGLLTVRDIGAKYCPVGAANDPRGVNRLWVPDMTILYRQLGGDPDRIPRRWAGG